MKKYVEYMGRVKASEELKGRILRGEEPKRRRGAWVGRLAYTAAGLAAVFAFGLIAWGLLGQAEPEPEPLSAGEYYGEVNALAENSDDDTPDDGIATYPDDDTPGDDIAIYPIVFNSAEQARPGIHGTGHMVTDRTEAVFAYRLASSENRMHAVFPGMAFDPPDFGVSATAYYLECGTFWYVNALFFDVNPHEITDADEYLTPRVSLGGVRIVIAAEGQLPPLMPLRYNEAVVSYIHGVAVTGFAVERMGFNNDLFLAEFTMGGVSYRVQPFGLCPGEDGITRAVNLLIAHGPADLTYLQSVPQSELAVVEIVSVFDVQNIQHIHASIGDTPFYGFLPEVPAGFGLANFFKFIPVRESTVLFGTDWLHMTWSTAHTGGSEEISWRASLLNFDDSRAVFRSSFSDFHEDFHTVLFTGAGEFNALVETPAEMWQSSSVAVQINEYFIIALRAFDLSPEEIREGIHSHTRFLMEESAPQPYRTWIISITVPIDDVLIQVNTRGLSPDVVFEIFFEPFM